MASAPWLACPRMKAHRATTSAAESLGALSRCLLGRSADPSEQRFRRVVISASLQRGTTEPGEPAWPARCSPSAAALQAAAGTLRELRAESCGGACCQDDEICTQLDHLLALLAELRAALGSGALSGGIVAGVIERAAAAGLTPDEAGPAPAPPPPVELPSPEQLRPVARGAYRELLTDPAGSGALRLLLSEPERRQILCTIELPSQPAPARCGSVPAAIPSGGASGLLAAESGAPLHVWSLPGPDRAGSDGFAGGIYHVPSGRRVLGLTSWHGGMVWRDGTVAVLLRDEEQELPYSLRRLQDGVIEAVAPLDIPSASSVGPHLVWDEIIWATQAADGSERLHAQRALARGEPVVEAATDLGPTGPLPGGTQLEACRTPEALVVVLAGEPQGYERQVTLAFRLRDGWQELLTAKLGSSWFGLTCSGVSASLSWIEALAEQPLEGSAQPEAIAGDYAIQRLRCTPAEGCQPEQAVVGLQRYSRSSRYVIGDLGSAVALLWRSPLGDVRLRIAPPAQLDEAPDIPLFDDADHGGFAWELGRGEIFVRDRTAILLAKSLLGGEPSTYGFRLDEHGGVVPLEVRATP